MLSSVFHGNICVIFICDHLTFKVGSQMLHTWFHTCKWVSKCSAWRCQTLGHMQVLWKWNIL